MSQVLAPNLPINGSQSVSSSMTQFSPELDLSSKNVLAPIYRYHRLTQVSGGSSVSLQTTSQTQSIFNIPGQPVYNLSKSFLEFDVIFRGEVKDETPAIWADQIPIDQLILQTNTGTQLALLQNVAAYTKVMRPAMTKYVDYIGNEPAFGAFGASALVANANARNTTNIFMQPGVNQPKATLRMAAGEVCTQYPLAVLAGTADTFAESPVATNLILASGVDKAFQAAQRLCSGATVAANPPADATDLNRFHCKIPFSAFKGTILAMDKNLYFGQNLQLTINWSGTVKWGVSYLPTDNAPSFGNLTASAVNGASAMENLFLWTCTDTNLATQAMLKDEVNSNGISLLIPWTQATSITSPAIASNFRYSTIITPGSGLVLKRIATIPIMSSDTLSTTSNCDNTPVAGVNPKWSTVQSFLNAVPLQDLPLADVDNQVWVYMNPMLNGSAHGLSNRQYRINAFWCDNFSDSKHSCEWDEEDGKFSGLALGTDSQVYDTQFTQTSSASLKYLQYQTYLRKLYIKPSGISY